MPREKLYDPNNFLPSGKEYTGVRHVNKTSQDHERDVTQRQRVKDWQKRLNAAAGETCDTPSSI